MVNYHSLENTHTDTHTYIDFKDDKVNVRRYIFDNLEREQQYTTNICKKKVLTWENIPNIPSNKEINERVCQNKTA